MRDLRASSCGERERVSKWMGWVCADVGTIYCIDLFESALNSNRKVKVVHETDTPHAFDVT